MGAEVSAGFLHAEPLKHFRYSTSRLALSKVDWNHNLSQVWPGLK